MLGTDDKSRRAHAVTPALNAILRASDGILDLLPIATFVCDAQGTILQYNKSAVEIWGYAPKPGQTHEDFTAGVRFFDIDGKPLERSGFADVMASGEPARDLERIVERADGSRVAVSLNIDPLRNAKGEIIGAVSCFLDITERKRMDAALEHSREVSLEQEQRLAATYEHAAIGISETAPDGTFLRVNEAICAITGYSREHLLANQLFSHTHPEDIDPDREGFRKQINGELDFYSVEKRFIRKDGRIIWMSVRSSPVRDADGKLLYLVRVVQDITDRKAAERRAKLLIDELNHRVKNTLATVQSLASQSARGSPSPAAFRESFEGRLIALSKAHDQLTQHHWESADLRELVSGSLAPYAGTDRVVLRGEDVVLRPRAVLTLAMTFHELATNAAKYGALSEPGGRIEIRWQPVRLEGGDGRAVLQIDWLEQGGPPVVEPAQRSFGSKLIEGSVKAELGGSARLVFAEEGLRCEILIPLEAATIELRSRQGSGHDWSI
ncbi:MAG TPA: PAS domain S-box protein [Pseudolabrys sp.]|nr:PAS domain S-box protein [Pseudolabrys sp.]